MFKVTIIEIKEVRLPTTTPEAAVWASATEQTVLLEQTLERLNLRAVIDALNPPQRKHRAKL